ncbi:hypothetical protein L198_02461 [Cryptococcus wingfieldii CBS 7118]|uniref:Uncharacterized protein n=1 Tax=Cryptococcus wingfieldii CBS 7118 TaxID=1295528 RepID=A0A1E3JRV4_9TREE|nr:hypothetical protein L198_02461 [Cryptococcus wingfieldii CBS 7118]ODO03611.1 hypothetical protein L198_02461 [Cryptococcus wingfieldii CBS 7118]
MSTQAITTTPPTLPSPTNASDGAFRILEEVEPTIFQHLAALAPTTAMLICKAYHNSTKNEVYREFKMGTAMLEGFHKANPGLDDSAPRRLALALQNTRVIHVDDKDGAEAYENLLRVGMTFRESSPQLAFLPMLKKVEVASEVTASKAFNTKSFDFPRVQQPVSVPTSHDNACDISSGGDALEYVAHLRCDKQGHVWSPTLLPTNSQPSHVTEIYHLTANDAKSGSLPIFRYGDDTSCPFLSRQLILSIEPPKDGETCSPVLPAIRNWLWRTMVTSQEDARASERLLALRRKQKAQQPMVTVHVPCFSSMEKSFYEGCDKVQVKQLDASTCEAYGLSAEYAW